MRMSFGPTATTQGWPTNSESHSPSSPTSNSAPAAALRAHCVRVACACGRLWVCVGTRGRARA